MATDYYTLERKLQTGDVVLFYTKFVWYRPITWLAIAIRKIAKVHYNHAGVVVSNWGVLFLNEALGHGVKSIPLQKRLQGTEIKVLRRAVPKEEATLAILANSVLGYTPYDFKGTLLDQLRYHINKKKKWYGWLDVPEAEKRMYCYEYAMWVHSDIYPHWWKVDLHEVNYNMKYLYSIFEGKIL